MRPLGPRSKHLVSLLACLLALFPLAAQNPSGSLRGQVVDPSGAAVAGATVLVIPSAGPALTLSTNREGAFEARTLAPGRYAVKVFANGFAPFESREVAVEAGAGAVVHARLSIEEQKEKVEVSESTTQLDTSGASNAN